MPQSNVPRFRFKDDDGNDYPDWEEKRLYEITYFENGKGHEQQIDKNGNFIVINSKFISTNGKVKKYTKSQLHPLEVGDIAFVMSDVPNGKALARCYYVEQDNLYSLNQRICVFKYKNVNPRYLFYALNRNKYFLLFDSGVGQTNLRKDDIINCRLTLPSSRVEQKKIASTMTSVDSKIDKLTRKKELLEEYKKGAMQKLFSREIRFKDENGDDFPDWEEVKLGDVASIVMGQSPDSKSYNQSGEGMPLIQGNADIINRVSNPRQWTSLPTKTCFKNDLIMTVRAPVGSISKSIHNACIGRGVCLIRSNDKSNLEYLYQFLLNFEPKWVKLEQEVPFKL